MLISLSILHKIDTDYYFLEHIDNSSKFGYFRKKYVKEAIIFVSRTISQKISCEQNTIVNTKEYQKLDYHCQSYKIIVTTKTPGTHSYLSHSNKEIVFLAITQPKYPQYLVFRLLKQIQVKYLEDIQDISFQPQDVLNPKFLEIFFNNSQTPEKFSKLYNLKKKVENTKKLVTISLEKLVERGEKLEYLITQTRDLSQTSKDFLNTSKKMNRCCNIL